MPKKHFKIVCEESRELEISWGAFWKDFTVYLDGLPLGSLSPRELRAGQTFDLPDGTELSVKLRQSLFSAELQLLHAGQPLPGSATDPIQRVKQAYLIIFVVGAFNLILGIAGIFFEAELLAVIGVGWGTAVFGLFLLFLGLLVKERQSQPALITAIIMYLADSLLGIVATIAAGGTPGVGGILVRIIFIVGMVQGISALRAQNRSNKKQKATTLKEP